MTKLEMVNHVCSIVGTSDAESVALAKTFLDRRYGLIWDAHPWRETLDVTEATATLGFRDVVFTQRQDADRILAVCWNDEIELSPVEWVSLWQRNPAAFQADGGALGSFTHLRRTAVLKGNDWLAFYNEQFGLMARSTTTATLAIDGLPFNDVRKTVSFTTAGSFAWGNIEGTWREIYGVTLSGAFDDFLEVAPSDDLTTNVFYGNVTAGQPNTLPTYLQIRMAQKADTADRTVRAIVKLRCDALTDDTTPLLPNVSEPLMALVQSDLLERQRQYSKAQAKRSEGNSLIQGLLVDLQRRQTADGCQIMPEIGAEYGAPGKGFW